ncbi:centromere-associated protein E-like [Acanthopagrus latus]|uniref:centromere-associated protein E-like n=1 Tax=Acanthopagrus latus TaxID=8177 RepID=UPI00187CCE24|nr:centromere-associated protein E-like [Acanthopagrus latus]
MSSEGFSLSKDTSPGQDHSVFSIESRGLSDSDTKGEPESQESQTLHMSEMPSRTSGDLSDFGEHLQGLFRSKVTMFGSLSQDRSAGNTLLRSNAQILRKRVEIPTAVGGSPKQQHVSIASELSQCDSLTETQDQQNLQTDLQALQCPLNAAEQHIFDKDGCRRRQEEEVFADVETFRQQCSLFTEKCFNLTAEWDHLKALREEQRSEVNQLREALLSLQHNEQILTQDINSLTAEGVRYKSQIQTNQAEIELLKRMARNENENHLAARQQLESLIDSKEGEIQRLRVALQGLHDKEERLNEDVHNLTAESVQLKHLNETNQAEIKQLKATVRALKDSEDCLKQQHVGISNELSQLESLTEKQIQQNKDLKTAVRDLQCLLDEAEQQIFDKDELIKKQGCEIEYSQQLVEELNTQRTDMNQSIRELKDQLEAKQEEEVLAGVEKFNQHCSIWGEKCDDLTAERDQLLSVREQHQTEIDQLRVLTEKQGREILNSQQLVEALYTERTELNQSICDLKKQLEMRQKEEVSAGVANFSQQSGLLAENTEKPDSPEKLRDGDLPESPAAEPPAAEGQTRGFWRPCAERLRKICVSVCHTVANVLISGGVRVYTFFMDR